MLEGGGGGVRGGAIALVLTAVFDEEQGFGVRGGSFAAAVTADPDFEVFGRFATESSAFLFFPLWGVGGGDAGVDCRKKNRYRKIFAEIDNAINLLIYATLKKL